MCQRNEPVCTRAHSIWSTIESIWPNSGSHCHILRGLHGGAILCVQHCAVSRRPTSSSIRLSEPCSHLKLESVGNRVDTDGVKLFCGNMAKTVADRAMQTLGGYGYVGEYNVERLWRDAKLLEIGGGTNESHQKNMTRDLASSLSK